MNNQKSKYLKVGDIVFEYDAVGAKVAYHEIEKVIGEKAVTHDGLELKKLTAFYSVQNYRVFRIGNLSRHGNYYRYYSSQVTVKHLQDEFDTEAARRKLEQATTRQLKYLDKHIERLRATERQVLKPEAKKELEDVYGNAIDVGIEHIEILARVVSYVERERPVLLQNEMDDAELKLVSYLEGLGVITNYKVTEFGHVLVTMGIEEYAKAARVVFMQYGDVMTIQNLLLNIDGEMRQRGDNEIF